MSRELEQQKKELNRSECGTEGKKKEGRIVLAWRMQNRLSKSFYVTILSVGLHRINNLIESNDTCFIGIFSHQRYFGWYQ